MQDTSEKAGCEGAIKHYLGEQKEEELGLQASGP
jgi:hypothetical protein